MDCLEALETLEAVALKVWDGDAESPAAARRHLDECSHCQREWPLRQQWSRALGDAISAVPIPEGLHQRVQAAHAVVPLVAESSLHRHRRALIWATVAMVLLAALGVGLAFWPSEPVPLSTLALASEVTRDELPPFSGRYQPRLPEDWEPYFDLKPSQVHGFPATGPQAGRIGLVPFQFTLKRGVEPLQGRLLILKRWQLVEADRPHDNFRTAEIRYLSGRAGGWIVWTEGDWVYVCIIPTARGPADLGRLLDALTAPRPLS